MKHRLGVDDSVFGHRFDSRLDPVLVAVNLPGTAFCLAETLGDLLDRKIPILAYRFPVHLESACHLRDLMAFFNQSFDLHHFIPSFQTLILLLED